MLLNPRSGNVVMTIDWKGVNRHRTTLTAIASDS